MPRTTRVASTDGNSLLGYACGEYDARNGLPFVPYDGPAVRQYVDAYKLGWQDGGGTLDEGMT